MKRFGVFRLLAGAGAAAAALSGSVWAQDATSEPLADNMYEPTLESLNAREVPEWYRDAKLGIFVHWGIYAVPGYAPLTGELDEVLAENATEDGQPGWPYWFANNPYAEWYANSMLVEDSDTANHHAETYGADFEYNDFAPQFNEQAAAWNAEDWASLFADVGARYVVLTSKHHDGFLLWPSDVPNPNLENWQAERDIVGELAEAVRAENMDFGLYYSGGIDWTFAHPTIVDFETLIAAIPQDEAYSNYALAHWNELVERYQPSILWNDLGFPQVGQEGIYQLFANYFNGNPDGVVNDRFALGQPREAFHNTFYTAEYAEQTEISPQVWESTRGMGYSFGYNMLDSEANVITVDDLVDSFADIVSKNGNLLLNVGPRADGSIPEVYLNVLNGFGDWLDVNGEAIFDTRPYEVAEGTATDANGGEGEVRFTRAGDESAVYAIVLTPFEGDTLTISGLVPGEGATVTLLGADGELAWEATDDGFTVTLPDMAGMEGAPAYSLRVSVP